MRGQTLYVSRVKQSIHGDRFKRRMNKKLRTMSKPAYLFVTGGVLSGIGKGTIASSIGLLLRGYGFRVSAVKIDPYLNIDAGKMSPYEHGECYVLADGAECDLDLGNYERFLGIDLTKEHSITTGQIYQTVIEKERQGEFLGKTVQIIPHITDHITQRIQNASKTKIADIEGVLGEPDIVVVEIGGTIGDIESEPFLYALSRFEEVTGSKVCSLHVGLLINHNCELKTKPLQHSIQELRARGVSPDILCVRTDQEVADISDGIRKKLSQSCHMAADSVIFSGKVKSIYNVPEMLHSQLVCELVCRRMGLGFRASIRPNFSSYQKILSYQERIGTRTKVKISLVAKYNGGADTYLSLTRALEHAAFEIDCDLDAQFVNADQFDITKTVHGIVVPGGFGDRGIEGKIKAIAAAKEAKKPLLGLCLGMQLMAIEHMRTQEYVDANSVEFNPNTTYPVIKLVPGGEMRLGNQTIELTGKAKEIYESQVIVERHRHRYQVDLNMFTPETEYYIVSGVDETGHIPEIIECVSDDWWAMGAQFHPEFISRNNKAHPMFVAFLKEAVKEAT